MTRHPKTPRRGARLFGSALVIGALCLSGLVTAPAASAHSTRHHPNHHKPASLGTTTVTTVKGIAPTLLNAGIVPLPARNTGFGLSFRGGLAVSYGFPITSSTANLAAGTGDILHAGGIRFVSRTASLAIGNFDVDLAAGKVFATRVNGQPGRIAVLDLDLSGLQVGTGRGGSTVLTGITATLDGAAAGALNATFGLALPTDGSLAFATVRIVLKG